MDDALFGDDDQPSVSSTAESLLMFERAPLPLVVLDEAGRILLTNEALRDMLGYELGELEGVDALSLTVAPARSWKERVEAGPVTADHPVTLVRRDATEITVWSSSLLVRNGSGSVRYAIAKLVADTSL